MVATPEAGSEMGPLHDQTPLQENNENVYAVGEADQPVDYGVTAWLQVLGGFLLFTNSWGLTNTYGFFQTFYLHNYLPSYSASQVSWIGSVQFFLTMSLCLPVGLLYDAGYLFSLIVIGTLFEVLGLVVTSFCRTYWQLMLAQGILCGLGSGMIAILPVAGIARWFVKKRQWANGLGTSGAALAGIIYPLMLKSLIPRIGFAWSTRCLAFMILGGNAVAFVVMRRRSGEKRAKGMLKHLSDQPYTAVMASWTITIAAAYVPFFYIEDYALSLRINPRMAYATLSFMNAANLFGRFALGGVADHFGGVNTLIPLNVVLVITLLAFREVSNVVSVIAVVLIYGFISGAMISLQAPTMINVSSDPSSQIGMKLGLGYACAAFGGLVGNPLSGTVEMKGETDSGKRYQGIWFTAAAFVILSTVCLFVARKLKLGSWIQKGFV